MTLFEYFTGLAEEGETALIVRQIDTGSLHADGTPRYTWPAYYPKRKRKEDESWYLNTGSFIVDRFKDGKPSASMHNCTHTLFMMLDDIGTKSKTPPLAPTAIVETSPGNYQYWYAYREQPTIEKQCAALTAIAAAGYTDPGATNAVRNCRLPGSVNVKPGREAFVCREIEFHPEREYILDEICEALGVTPSEESAKAPTIRVKDTGDDIVLRWLSDNGHVLERANNAGWVGVVCPNAHEHTDGSLGARYLPATRAFCCYHGHCSHIDSRAFLQWVCDNGGPQAEHGLRDDITAGVMSEALSKITPNDIFTDKAKEAVEAANRREAGRKDRTEWFERFAYVMSDDAYFDLDTRQEMPRGVFNAIFRHVHCISRNGGRRIEASVWYDEHRQDSGGRALTGITYAPGETELVVSDGLIYGNKWINARPKVEANPDADVLRWLAHAEMLIPDEDERRHVFDAMAYKVQNPRVKINHAVLHGGDEGCGKDTLWAPFIWAVCGPRPRNRGLIDADGLTSQWGYAFESEILILNELREPEARERRALANRLKPVIAAPPETISINRKSLHPYEAMNRMFVLAFTNDPVPITLPSQDRRWFCIWSHAPRMPESEAVALWRWYQSGGFEAVASWLLARDVSAFNPAATPMETEFKRCMIENGMSSAETSIIDKIRAGEKPFHRGFVGGSWAVLEEELSVGYGAPKIYRAAILHALKEAGWVDIGRVHSATNPTKKQVWVAPELLARRVSKTLLRDLLEKPDEPVDNVVNLRKP